MNMVTEKAVITVSQFTHQLKHIVEQEYRFVWIRGEISNLRTPYSGHSYFVLKDSGSQLRGVLFKQQKRYLDIRLKDGLEVVCFGRITVYEPRGEYQLVVDSVQLQGKGSLQRQFEELKNELNDQGYFDTHCKKTIPAFPKSVCVITSPTGAAIKDFLKITGQRQYPANIHIFPVRVQGELASQEISEAIQRANSSSISYDIIVLCRGGGSIEDLWAFNERQVADAIFSSDIPVVTGIGHEIDTTISDFCADLRCPTPTAVAERIFPDRTNLLELLSERRNRIVSIIQNTLRRYEQQVDYSIRMLGDAGGLLESNQYRLLLAQKSLFQTIHKKIEQSSRDFSAVKSRFVRQAPLAKIERQYGRLTTLETGLLSSIQKIVAKADADLGKAAALLHGVSPLATLGRGYSITRKLERQPGKPTKLMVLRKATDVKPGETLNILLQKGELECTVERCLEE